MTSFNNILKKQARLMIAQAAESTPDQCRLSQTGYTSVVDNLSLNAMAKKQTKIRNALDLPLKTQWHQIGTDKVDEIKSKLHRFLSPMKLKSFKPPWKEMKRASPMERKTKRKQFFESRDPQEIEQYKSAVALRKNVFIGVNALSRGIENNTVSCGLLAGDASPKILIKHVAELARQTEIPMLVLPGLKTITKNSLGFSAIALGFMKNVNSNDEISEYVKSLSGELGSVSTIENEEVIEEAVEISSSVKVPEKECEFDERTYVHLTRSEPLQRAFHPPSPSNVDEGKSEKTPLVSSSTVENFSSDPSLQTSQCERKWRDSTHTKFSSTDLGFSLKRRRDSSSLPNADKEVNSGIKLPKVSFSLTEHHGRYFMRPTVVQIKSNPSKHRKKKKKRKT